MIGLCATLCIKEICMGKVALESVRKIICGLDRCSSAEFDSAISKYWSDFPDEAERIFRVLDSEGKIEYPSRKRDKHYHPRLFKKEDQMRIWVDSEREIMWMDGKLR